VAGWLPGCVIDGWYAIKSILVNWDHLRNNGLGGAYFLILSRISKLNGLRGAYFGQKSSFLGENPGFPKNKYLEIPYFNKIAKTLEDKCLKNRYCILKDSGDIKAPPLGRLFCY